MGQNAKRFRILDNTAGRRRSVAVIGAAVVLLNTLGISNALAQEQIMFPAVQDAQACLLQKIRSERVRIDVGIWILGDWESFRR